MDYGKNILEQILEKFNNMSVDEYVSLYESVIKNKQQNKDLIILTSDIETLISYSKDNIKGAYSYILPINDEFISINANSCEISFCICDLLEAA